MLEKKWTFLPWWVFSLSLSLAALGAAVFIGWVTGKATYKAVLADGAYYVFSAVLIAEAFAGFFYELVKKKPKGRRVRLSANVNLLTLGAGILFGGTAIVLYSVTVLAKYGGPAIERGIQTELATASVVFAVSYSLACAKLRHGLI